MRGTSWRMGAVLALGALAPRAAVATAYYVNDSSTAGDRAFPGCASMGAGVPSAPCGTCARPCDSPQLAYDANPVGPGDTIFLNAGRYSPDAGTPGLELDVPGKEGAPSAPLVVEGLLDSSGRCARDDAGVPLVLLDGRGTGTVGVFLTVSFVTVKGFGITDMAPSDFEPFGSGVRIVGGSALDGGEGPTGFVVTGMDIYRLNGGGASPVDIDDWVTSCPGCEVSWNRLHDCGTCNAAVWVQGPPGVRVVGNEISSNSFYASGTPAQIHLAGAPSPVIRNNLVYANGGDALGLIGCRSARACGAQVTSAAEVINNTFWRNALITTDSDTAEIALETGSDGGVFENNLIGFDAEPVFYSDGTTFAASDYNGYQALGAGPFLAGSGTQAGSFQEWQGLGFDLNGLVAAPLFDTSSFHLASTAGWFDPSGALQGNPQTSPFLDLGDPLTPIGLQRAPNRGRVNLGAYGGTAEASLTPVTLVAVSGDGQVADAGAGLGQPLVVAVRCLDGVGAEGVAVTFSLAGGGSLAPGVAYTDDAGLASARLMLGAPGSTSVRASLAEVLDAGQVTFTATALPPVVEPDAGPPDAGPPGSFDVSCNCASGGRPAVLAALLLVFAFVRRPRR